nr:unnamed protein product [Digitaria exilis]
MASSSASPAPAGDSLRQKRILSSKLYLEIPSSKAPVIYSPAYDISFLGLEKLHPFDSAKWGRICRYLTREGHLEKQRVVEPLEACKEDLLVVHTEAYLNSLKSSFRVANIVEVPPVSLVPNWIVQKKLLYPFRKQVDFAAMQYIDQKIELASGTKTDEYLENLDQALEVCKSRFQPQLIVYNAGTDILDGDPLGRLKVSPEGVVTRDEKVFRFARDQNIPLLMLTSGEIL